MTFDEWCQRWQIPEPAIAELKRSVHGVPHPAVAAESETATQQFCRIAAAQEGFALWRNNNGAFTDADGRHVRYGVGNDSKKLNKVWKSSDLVGIGPGGRFMAVEVKHPQWVQPENERDRAQLNMLTQVEALGGVGQFVTHVNQYRQLIIDMKEGKR